MSAYTLYTQNLKDEVIQNMNEIIKEHDVVYSWRIKLINDIYEIGYILNEEKQLSDEIIANALCDLVQKQVILLVCHNFFKRRDDLNKLEREEITQAFMTNSYLSRQEGASYITYYLVYLPVYKEIREKGTLNIDGLIRFRVKKYQTFLHDILEQFVEDYSAKKDVIRFIRVMRDVTLLAVPLEELVHLVFKKNGKIQLYNKEKQNITGHYIKKYCKDLILDSTLTQEDLILHVLITISPKQLIVHARKNNRSKSFENTIEIIFEESITYCSGCSFCKTEIS